MGGPPGWGLGECLITLPTPRHKKDTLLRIVTQGLGIGRILWIKSRNMRNCRTYSTHILVGKPEDLGIDERIILEWILG